MEKRLFVLFLAFSWLGGVRAETPVHFADDRLKEAVEAELWIPDPTPEDMLGLTRLYAGDDGIVDLTGLEYAANLQALELPSNDIRDLSPLSGLSGLQVVSLRSNGLSDVSALSGLSNLRELDLFDNQISDISAFSSLESLETLNLQRNQVGGVSSLAGLHRLRSLDLHRNQISDISALVDLPSLEWLDLRINPLNEESYSTYIPQILENHPDMWLAYYSSTRRRLALSSTAGGSVTQPGEGEFTFEHGEVVWLQAQAEAGFTFVNWSGSYAELHSSIYLTVDDNFEMRANFLSTRDVLFVNSSTLRGQGAAGLSQSSPHEDGTTEHPFNRIQEAIEVAAEGASIVVYPGHYQERIDFLGKSIRLIGMEVNEPHGATWPVIDGGGAGTVVTFAGGEDPNSMLLGFTITGGRAQSAGAIQCMAGSPTIANCLIVGNRATDLKGAAVFCTDSTATLINCVVADNYAREGGAGLYLQDSPVVVVSSIVRGDASTGIVKEGSDPNISYSDIAGGWPGRGNIDTDPLFAGPGHWANRNDPNVHVGPTHPNAVWVMGDYHLKSRTGRWDPAAGLWVQDEIDSPCIDAGDPRSSVSNEPVPHGGVINMGAYGGTAQASRSHTPSAAGN